MQVKSAFTRAFNAQHLRPKTGFKMEGGVKKKGRGGGASLEGGADEFGAPGSREGGPAPVSSSTRLHGIHLDGSMVEWEKRACTNMSGF